MAVSKAAKPAIPDGGSGNGRPLDRPGSGTSKGFSSLFARTPRPAGTTIPVDLFYFTNRWHPSYISFCEAGS